MSNTCKLHKHYKYHVQFHVQQFFSKQATTAQSNCLIFFPQYFEIPSFCKYIIVHISKNQRYTWSNNSVLKELEILVHIFFFVCLIYWEFWYIHVFTTTVKKRLRRTVVREPQQKTFVALSGFWPFRGIGWGARGRGGSVNPLEKENLWRKFFVPMMLNEVLKIFEKWYLLM